MFLETITAQGRHGASERANTTAAFSHPALCVRVCAKKHRIKGEKVF